jgi:hypothetical protein
MINGRWTSKLKNEKSTASDTRHEEMGLSDSDILEMDGR